MKLEDAKGKEGAGVLYLPAPYEHSEIGIICSVTDNYIHVKYGDDLRSKATRPEDLLFIGDLIDLLIKFS